MTNNKIRRLPVEENGKLVGIVTVRDISNKLRYSLGKQIIKDKDYSRPGY
jgi:CBS domain-containing protein